MTEAAGTPIHHQQYNTEPLTTSSKGKNGAQSTLQIGQAGEQVEVSNLSTKKGMQTSHQDHIAAVSGKISNEPMAKAGQALMPHSPHEHEGEDAGMRHQVSPSPNGKSEDVHAVMKKVILPQEEESAEISEEQNTFLGNLFGGVNADEQEISGEQNAFLGNLFGGGREDEIPEEQNAFLGNLFGGLDNHEEAIPEGQNNFLSNLFAGDSFKEDAAKSISIAFGSLSKDEITMDSLASNIKNLISDIKKEKNITVNPEKIHILTEYGLKTTFSGPKNSALKLDIGQENPAFIIDNKFIIPERHLSQGIVFFSLYCSENKINFSDFDICVVRESDMKLFVQLFTLMMNGVEIKPDDQEGEVKKEEIKPNDWIKQEKNTAASKKQVEKEDEVKKYKESESEIGKKVAQKFSEAAIEEAKISRERDEKKQKLHDEKEISYYKHSIEHEELKKSEIRKEDIRS